MWSNSFSAYFSFSGATQRGFENTDGLLIMMWCATLLVTYCNIDRVLKILGYCRVFVYSMG